MIIGGGGNYAIHVLRNGYPLGQFFGLKWNGVYQLSDFDYDENLPHESRTYRLKEGVPYSTGYMNTQVPGDPKFADISGPEGVPDGIIDAFDRHVIGNATPKHFGGMTNNFKYKSFDLRVFVNWSYGNQIYNWQKFRFGMPKINNTQNYLADVANYWTPENPTNDMPRLNSVTSVGIRDLSYGNTFMVEDGSYLRLASVVLGYQIPAKVLSMAKISSIRVYASAENLYVWTNYSGYDPEVSMGRNPLNPGIDSNPYPRSRTYMLGVNVNF
jgi:TonB-dependent starch-binding outer membrane protein SusC